MQFNEEQKLGVFCGFVFHGWIMLSHTVHETET